MKTLITIRAALTLIGVSSCAALPFLFADIATEIADATRSGVSQATDFASEALNPEWVMQMARGEAPGDTN
tara:strand:+ start:12197 stop:12409 length:213 start_codon:yes stop_codon:yes gene_type:complete